jgi:hypothetical protein
MPGYINERVLCLFYRLLTTSFSLSSPPSFYLRVCGNADQGRNPFLKNNHQLVSPSSPLGSLAGNSSLRVFERIPTATNKQADLHGIQLHNGNKVIKRPKQL